MQYQKGMSQIQFLKGLGMDLEDILIAICDENTEQTDKILLENPGITLKEFREKFVDLSED